MVMGVGLASDDGIATAAVAATIFYVVHHIIVKSSLFLVAGVAERVTGERELMQMGGIVTLAPALATLFFIGAMSLAGMPPFSGFLSKLVLLRVGLDGGHWLIVGAAVFTSFVTLLSMAKIWSYAFWGRPRHDAPLAPWRGMAIPISVLVGGTIVLGVWAQPFLRLAADAADDVVAPAGYVRAVLGQSTADSDVFARGRGLASR
jgi:multicomponent Na+:H+ antiporter subunit D